MLKYMHPFDLQPHIRRTMYDTQRNEEHLINPYTEYYDIYADVFCDESNKKNQSIIIPPEYIPPDVYTEESLNYGLVEYGLLEEVIACASYLQDRDNIPTMVSGIFGNDPVNIDYSIMRRCPSVYNDYTITHYGVLYKTDSLSLKHKYINPDILYKPAWDNQGYMVYIINIPGIGNQVIRIHELVGMTFWPNTITDPNIYTYCHRNGDRTDNHFQNIGVIYA